MKKAYVFVLGLVLLLLIGVAAGYFWWRDNSSAVSESKELVYVTIPRGKSASWIGEKLFEKNLIKSPLAFKFYVQFLGKQQSINAGQFGLSPAMDLAKIVNVLQGGPLELWVTIPEGLRREEVVEKLIESLEKDSVETDIFRQDFLELTKDKEGYLFPDTYLFPPDASASAVVNKMESTFNLKVNELKSEIASSNYSLWQIVTMASIIERETKTNEERPIVAGILWKRLETPGWFIQADATNQYVVGNVKCPMSNVKCKGWWPILTKDDLEIESPYNSYKYKNLPPTPIANPGFSSIEAAANPTATDYWFYLHDADGQIHYAETITEHNANVRKYLGK